MPRSPLTETIKRAEGMVHYVQENLSAEEYMLFLDMVDPLPEPVQKSTKKKSSKKSAGGGGRSASKSARASGMAAAIRDSLKRSQQAAANDEGDEDSGADQNDLLDPECSFIVNSVSGEKCNASKNDPIHDTTYLSSHEFVAPPASSAAGAGD